MKNIYAKKRGRPKKAIKSINNNEVNYENLEIEDINNYHINKIKNNIEEYNLYILKTFDILNEYDILTKEGLSYTDSQFINKKTELKIKLINIIDPFYVVKRSHSSNDGKEQRCTCSDFIIIEDSLTLEQSCQSCGLVYGENLSNIVDQTNMNYIDFIQNYDLTKTFLKSQGYERQNYYREKIDNLEASKFIKIPVDVVENIRIEMTKQRITNEKLTIDNIKQILKKINKPKFYKHKYYVYKEITGKSLIKIDDYTKYELEIKFLEYEKAFKELITREKGNSLCYNYVMYKLLEIIQKSEYKKFFELPKNQSRIIEYDNIWKKVCDYTKWEFRRTNLFF